MGLSNDFSDHIHHQGVKPMPASGMMQFGAQWLWEEQEYLAAMESPCWVTTRIVPVLKHQSVAKIRLRLIFRKLTSRDDDYPY